MPGSKRLTKAILHPVRARIIVSLGGRPLTPLEISKLMPDVPLGTLYRHINVLLESELLEVVRERRIHGTVERQFALKHGSTYLSDEEREELNAESLTGIVGSLTSVVSDAFARYAAQATPPYPEGAFSMVAQALYLTKEEVEEFRMFMRNFLSRKERTLGPDLERRLVAFFSVPDISDLKS